MTWLVVEEFKGVPLVQDFEIEKKLIVAAIRPYLYCHNFPSGTGLLEILDENDNVLHSKSFSPSDVYSGLETANPYAHAYLRVLFDQPFPMPKGNYKIKISASGYTFSESSYLGWVKEHEDLKVPVKFIVAGDQNNPLSFEIWSYEQCEY
jgi:hypothetical protein